MNIKAIPTLYKGCQFRSRLEAKWAAFFDLINWPWTYEPIDLNGWIPDFILGENIETGILCEVKPLDFMGLSHAQFRERTATLGRELDTAKNASKGRDGFLLLGLRPFWGGDFYAIDAKELGFSNNFHLADIGLSFFDRYQKDHWNQSFISDDSDDQLDIVIEQRPYRGAITGRKLDASSSNEHANEHVNEFIGFEHFIEPIWRRASNIVQWRAGG